MKDIELQTEAFKRYIQECDELSITPDYASAFTAAWSARAAIEADRAQRVPDDFLSHKSAWRAAIVIAQGFSANEDDSAYWSHEIKAFDMAYARLLASTSAQPAQQEPTFMRQFAAAKKEVEAVRNSPMGASVQEAVLVAQPAPQPVERKPMTEAVIRERARLHLQAGRSYRGLWEEGTELASRVLELGFIEGAKAAERHHGIRE